MAVQMAQKYYVIQKKSWTTRVPQQKGRLVQNPSYFGLFFVLMFSNTCVIVKVVLILYSSHKQASKLNNTTPGIEMWYILFECVTHVSTRFVVRSIWAMFV